MSSCRASRKNGYFFQFRSALLVAKNVLFYTPPAPITHTHFKKKFCHPGLKMAPLLYQWICLLSLKVMGDPAEDRFVKFVVTLTDHC